MTIWMGKYFLDSVQINKVKVGLVLNVLLRFKSKNKVFRN